MHSNIRQITFKPTYLYIGYRGFQDNVVYAYRPIDLSGSIIVPRYLNVYKARVSDTIIG